MDASCAPDSSKPRSVNQPSEWPLNGDRFLWEEYIPKLNPESVKKQIEGQYREQPYEPQPRELVSQSDDLQSQRDNSERTYLSFGNKGTTATATEWGQHVQISQYLNHGPSAFYAIDHEDTSEPFQMQKRTRDIQKLIENSQGFGPDILMPGNTNDWSISTYWLRNRWPRVVIKDKNIWEAVVQWYVQDNVVIQSIACQNYSDDPLNLWCTTNLHVRIRQLDIADDSHSFNRGDEPFAEGAGPGGFGFVRIQRLSKRYTGSKQQSDLDAVAAVIGLFVNGRAVTLEDYESNFSDFNLPAKEIFRLVVGYKLVPLKMQHGKENWKSLVLKTGDVDIDQFLLDTAPKDDVLPSLMLSDQEFYISRYVEHILSVCMIPIANVSEEVVPSSVASAADDLNLQSSKTNGEPKVRIVALTCGDMYGHRICVSASFFAYRFLLDVARRLPENHPVKVRIKENCFAHLAWIFEMAREKDASNFVRNYYVTGNVIPPSSTLPPNGLTDTPLQILKAYEYWKAFPESTKEIRKFLENDNFGMNWVKSLDQESKGDAFVWRHSQRAGLDYFRFDDHYWIWNAILAISDILEWDNWTKKQGKRTSSDDRQKEKASLARKYRPDKVKDEILRRFTTVYDVTKQRTLAVTRSARETRFEFHSRDTALFYQIANSNMLSPQEPRWLSTLQIQKTFLVNQESDLYNPLRHGLAILMAKEGVPISGSDVPTVRDEATKALTAAIPSNGLFIFPLQEDKDGNAKHPDYLANIFFEVPFILLSLHRSKYSSTEQETGGKGSLTNENRPAENSNRIISIESGIVPFNDQVDLKNVVDVKEEWLYNRPYFLEWEMPKKETLSEQISSLKMSKEYSELQQTTGSREIYDVLTQCASCSHQPTFEPKGNSDGRQALIDIGKRNIRQSVLTLTTIQEIWERLHKRRAAHEAKKRLMWFAIPSLDSALMCYLSSPDVQKPIVRQFFNRHANGANFFGDQTSRVLNRWVTEFHCSFLQLESGKPKSDDQERINAENPILNLFPGISLDKNNNHGWLSKTSAGFRFDGDFFDRFWTCYHIESYRNVRYPDSFNSNQVSGFDIKVNDFLSKGNLGKIFSHDIDHVWKQRKVLELLLFFRILSKAHQNGSIILQNIQSGLNRVQSEIDEITQRSSSRIDSFFVTTDLFDTRAELFFGSLAKWRELDIVLDMVDNHLEAILSNIKKWESREQDREPEKPRWTNKDERKYRDAINTALHLCQRVEQGLEIQKRHVTTLKRLLEKRRSEAQNNYNRDMSDRSYRQSVNITYFTYSTVIFLPLGFAASIYSMQAAPPTDVLQHMVICAIVTFVVLIILIVALPRCLRIMRKAKTALFPPHESGPRPPTVVELKLELESNRVWNSGFIDEKNITLWDSIKRIFKKSEGKSGGIGV